LKDGVDLVIGVGGDGTLNEITNGFFKKGSDEAINAMRRWVLSLPAPVPILCVI
jgi:diacylglycerol kinase family enzyme